jgi:ERCC4-type nuclease
MENLTAEKRQSIVDTREPLGIRQPLVRAGWREKALPCGDMQFYDSCSEVVLVERKTVKQFLIDLSSGQLQRQARLLAEASQFPILLIEGHWTVDSQGYLPDGYHTWEQAWNALQSLQDIGCRLQLTSSLEHTIERIFQLKEYYEKAYHSSVARHPSGDSRISVLSHIHGIDKAKSERILEALPTLQQVANAAIEQLIEIDGVGPKLAQRIYQFFRDSKKRVSSG